LEPSSLNPFNGNGVHTSYPVDEIFSIVTLPAPPDIYGIIIDLTYAKFEERPL